MKRKKNKFTKSDRMLKIEVGVPINAIFEYNSDRCTTASELKGMIADNYHISFSCLRLCNYGKEVPDNEVIDPTAIQVENQFRCIVDLNATNNEPKIQKEQLDSQQQIMVDTLVNMGYPTPLVLKALESSNYNYEFATSLLRQKIEIPNLSNKTKIENPPKTQLQRIPGTTMTTRRNQNLSSAQNPTQIAVSDESNNLYVGGQQINIADKKIIVIDTTVKKFRQKKKQELSQAKIPWLPNEDTLLMQIYEQFSTIKNKWEAISKQMPNRSKSEIQERVKYLKQQINQNNQANDQNNTANGSEINPKKLKLVRSERAQAKAIKAQEIIQTAINEMQNKANLNKEKNMQEKQTSEVNVVKINENPEQADQNPVNPVKTEQNSINSDIIQEKMGTGLLNPVKIEEKTSPQPMVSIPSGIITPIPALNVAALAPNARPIPPKGPLDTSIPPLPDTVIDALKLIKAYYDYQCNINLVGQVFPEFSKGYLLYLLNCIKVKLNMSKGANSWPRSDVRLLLELHSKGYTDAELSKAFPGRAERNVHDKRMRILKDLQSTKHLIVLQTAMGEQVDLTGATYVQDDLPSYLEPMLNQFLLTKKNLLLNAQLKQQMMEKPDAESKKPLTGMTLRERKTPVKIIEEPAPVQLWTPKDDQILLDAFAEFGNFRDKWVKIGSNFQKKSSQQISARWKTISEDIKRGLRSDLVIPESLAPVLKKPQFKSQDLPSKAVNFALLVKKYFDNNGDMTKVSKDFPDYMKGYLFFVLYIAANSYRRTNSTWERNEERLLCEMHFEDYSYGDISNALQNRSAEQCSDKISSAIDKIKNMDVYLKKTAEELEKNPQINLDDQEIDIDGLPIYFKDIFKFYDTTSKHEEVEEAISLGKRNWTFDEDMALLNKYAEIRGSKGIWKQIQEAFPSRSHNSIMKRFRTILNMIKEGKYQNITPPQYILDIIEQEKKENEINKLKIRNEIRPRKETQAPPTQVISSGSSGLKVAVLRRRKEDEPLPLPVQQENSDESVKELKPLPAKVPDILNVIRDFYDADGDEDDLSIKYPEFTKGYLIYLLDWLLRELSPKNKAQTWSYYETRFILEKHFEGVIRSKIADLLKTKDRYQIGSKRFKILDNLKTTSVLKEFADYFKSCPGIENSKFNSEDIPTYLPPMVATFEAHRQPQKKESSRPRAAVTTIPLPTRKATMSAEFKAAQRTESIGNLKEVDADDGKPFDLIARVSHLMNMGYSEVMSLIALKNNNFDVNQAYRTLKSVVFPSFAPDQCHGLIPDPELISTLDIDGQQKPLSEIPRPDIITQLTQPNKLPPFVPLARIIPKPPQTPIHENISIQNSANKSEENENDQNVNQNEVDDEKDNEIDSGSSSGSDRSSSDDEEEYESERSESEDTEKEGNQQQNIENQEATKS